jgi:hypothetical protein
MNERRRCSPNCGPRLKKKDPGVRCEREGAKQKQRPVMLFMAIERFRNQNAKAVYSRFRARGRMMPDGVTFVGSWVTADLGRCFQLMQCDDITLVQRWAAEWSDLIEFEIVPVVEGKDTGAALAAQP